MFGHLLAADRTAPGRRGTYVKWSVSGIIGLVESVVRQQSKKRGGGGLIAVCNRICKVTVKFRREEVLFIIQQRKGYDRKRKKEKEDSERGHLISGSLRLHH